MNGRQLVNQEVHWLSKEEERAVTKRMKNEKVIGPNDIPVEVWRH